jgi:aminoglycoside phosphotransferase (APT) family kinase protein
MLALPAVGPGADPPKPHPRHAWLPAFLPADARRFRIDDEELASALAASGAEIDDGGPVDAEIVGSPAGVSGTAASAFVRLDRGESDSRGPRALRYARRVRRGLRLRAAILTARRTLAARGYDTRHVGTWDRPRDPHVRLPGAGRRPRTFSSLLPRHALVAGYRSPRPPSYVEAAVSATAAQTSPAPSSALVTGSGILVVAREDSILRVAVGPAARLLDAERAALEALWRTPPPPFVSDRVPRPLGGDERGLGAWSLETRASGSATTPPYPRQFLDDCVEFLAELSTVRRSGALASPREDAAVIGRWCGRRQADELAQLAQEVEAALADLPRGFGHGDFAAGNLLGRGGRLSGVVDWAKGGPGRLTLLDLLHLRVNVEAARARAHLGEAIVDFLLPWAQVGGDAALADYEARTAVSLEKPQLEAAAVAYWLDFIGSEIAAYADRGQRRVWVEKNVLLVAERVLARGRSGDRLLSVRHA